MDIENLRTLVFGRLGPGATYDHCVATENCMRALARRFDEDPLLWAMTGLAHDLDLDECEEDLSNHTLIAAKVLAEQGAPKDLIDAVMGHNDKAPRTTPLARALWVVDPTTGMITASALVRPSQSTVDLTVQSIQKRMKDKRFAAAVNRTRIRACETELQIPLDEFLQLCLTAMQP